MSVKQWKQVITLVVIFTILFLLITTVVFTLKYFSIKREFNDEAATTIKLPTNYFDSINYQSLYEDMYVDNDFTYKDDSQKKVCYLTFDDGPNTEVTPEVLDTLKKYDVKATFFVIHNGAEQAKDLYKRIVDEGHTIAIHTSSHNYNKIYDSVYTYLSDFNKIYNYVYEVTGVKCEIFRFPGGSINGYNASVYQEIIAEMTRRGFTYYDWNVSSGDATASYISPSEITDNVVSGADESNKIIVLMHDGAGHMETAESLSETIERLQDEGYKFEALTKEVQPINFGYAS